jgi:hypothetical protein
VPWHDRFHHRALVVPAMPMPRMQSPAPARPARSQRTTESSKSRASALARTI